MKCSACHSEDTRRSRRRGVREGITLRLKQQAPFRCLACGLRFVAKIEDRHSAAAPHYVSIADYLGLRGWARRVFTDYLIVGGLGTFVLLTLVVLVFAFALGWIQPHFLLPEANSEQPHWSLGTGSKSAH